MIFRRAQCERSRPTCPGNQPADFLQKGFETRRRRLLEPVHAADDLIEVVPQPRKLDQKERIKMGRWRAGRSCFASSLPEQSSTSIVDRTHAGAGRPSEEQLVLRRC